MLRTKRTQKTVDKGQRSHTWTAVFHAIASGWSPRGAARRAAAGESHPGIPFIPYSCASSSTRAFFNWALYLSCRQVEIGKIRAGPKKVERVDPAPPGQLPTRPSRHQPIAGPDTLIGKPRKRSAGRPGGRGALPVTPLFKTALPDPAIPNNASPASPPTRARRPREPLVVFKISKSALFSRFPRKNAHLQTRSIRTTVAGQGRPDAGIPFDPQSCCSTSTALFEAFNLLIPTPESTRPKGIRQGRSRVDTIVPGGANHELGSPAGGEE